MRMATSGLSQSSHERAPCPSRLLTLLVPCRHSNLDRWNQFLSLVCSAAAAAPSNRWCPAAHSTM